MTTSKLPEWPEKAGYMDSSYPQYFKSSVYEAAYCEAVAEAALARMEALVEYLGALGMKAHLPVCNYPHDFPCCCGLEDLLAACARKEAGR